LTTAMVWSFQDDVRANWTSHIEKLEKLWSSTDWFQGSQPELYKYTWDLLSPKTGIFIRSWLD